jgi:hypothetical protein
MTIWQFVDAVMDAVEADNPGCASARLLSVEPTADRAIDLRNARGRSSALKAAGAGGMEEAAVRTRSS